MSAIRQITAKELQSSLREVVLVDVRLPDDFEAGHLPGAIGNCVFEVAFCDRVPGICADKARPIVVYGEAADSHESRVAADKLARLGHTNVSDFREGFRGWKAAGFPIEGRAAASAVPVPNDGRHDLDLAESRIEWTGRNLLNKHTGNIALKSGFIEISGAQLAGGEFEIDLHQIRCADLAGNPLHEVLIAHLLSDDFFDAERFPVARFRIDRAESIPGAAAGQPNLDITGTLDLRGVQAPLRFQASAGLTPDGKPAAQAVFSFDRTIWEVIYGSGKLFRRLAGHLVNDLIDIQLRVVVS